MNLSSLSAKSAIDTTPATKLGRLKALRTHVKAQVRRLSEVLRRLKTGAILAATRTYVVPGLVSW